MCRNRQIIQSVIQSEELPNKPIGDNRSGQASVCHWGAVGDAANVAYLLSLILGMVLVVVVACVIGGLAFSSRYVGVVLIMYVISGLLLLMLR